MEKLSIKNWAEDDRPREKMINKGRLALSDAELIGILIGSGTKEYSAIDLAKKLLNQCNNDLNELAKLSIAELKKTKGIGEARAINIVTAMELGRRRKETQSPKNPIITSSKDAYEVLNPYLADRDTETFYTVYLNQANRVLAVKAIGEGGINFTPVDIRMIFKNAVEINAVRIIVGHNHPSGALRPSQPDINITEKIAKGGEFLDIKLIDHIIVGEGAYYSFADESKLPV